MIRVISAAGAMGMTPEEQAAVATKRAWVNVSLAGGALFALGLLWWTKPKRRR